MLRSLTAKQFREWRIYSELEPFDNDREEALHAQTAQMIANANRPKQRRNRPYRLDEVMLTFGDAPRPTTPVKVEAVGEAIRKLGESKEERPALIVKPISEGEELALKLRGILTSHNERERLRAERKKGRQ